MVALCAVAACPFLPALDGEFTNWDDNVNVTSNPYVRGGFSDGLLRLLSAPYVRLYIPVTYALFWVQFHLWGDNPVGFHLVNLLCHLAGVCLLYSLFRTLFSSWWIAAAASAWWAVHPLHAEPVAWITGFKDVLSGMLVFLCWRLYVADRRRTSDLGSGRAVSPALLAAICAFLLACLSKPAAVMFPFVLLGYELLTSRPGAGRLAKKLLPFFVVAAAVAGITLLIHQPEQAGVAAPEGLTARLRLVANSAVFYLGKILWPSDLCPVYGRTVDAAATGLGSWIGLGMAVVVCVGAVLAGRRLRLGALVFAACLLPVSGVVAFGYMAYSTVADRYAYLPSVGVALVLGDLLQRATIHPGRRLGWRGVLIMGCFAVWIGGLGALTWRQTGVWQNSVSVWTRVMAVNPRPSASVLVNYGSALFRAGRVDEALRVLRRCVAQEPDYARGRYNLARVLYELDDLDSARAEYARTLELYPDYVNAWIALGALEARRRDFTASAAASKRALELEPRNPTAAMNLGLALLELRRPAKAAEALKLAVELRPDDAEARHYLNIALGEAQALTDTHGTSREQKP